MHESGSANEDGGIMHLEAHGNAHLTVPSQAPIPAQEKALFFARFPPSISSEEVERVFAQHGIVESVNLYRTWATAKTSKGCGIVVFDDHASAAAALEALDGKCLFPDSGSTVAVEWLDSSKQKEQPSGAGSGSQKRRRPSSHSSTTGSRRLSFVHEHKREHMTMREVSCHNTRAVSTADRGTSLYYALTAAAATGTSYAAEHGPSACASGLLALDLGGSCNNSVGTFAAFAGPQGAKLNPSYCNSSTDLSMLGNITFANGLHPGNQVMSGAGHHYPANSKYAVRFPFSWQWRQVSCLLQPSLTLVDRFSAVQCFQY